MDNLSDFDSVGGEWTMQRVGPNINTAHLAKLKCQSRAGQIVPHSQEGASLEADELAPG